MYSLALLCLLTLSGQETVPHSAVTPQALSCFCPNCPGGCDCGCGYKRQLAQDCKSAMLASLQPTTQESVRQAMLSAILPVRGGQLQLRIYSESWCQPCQQLKRDLKQNPLAGELKRRGIQVVVLRGKPGEVIPQSELVLVGKDGKTRRLGQRYTGYSTAREYLAWLQRTNQVSLGQNSCGCAESCECKHCKENARLCLCASRGGCCCQKK